jgi:hypothetical protein
LGEHPTPFLLPPVFKFNQKDRQTMAIAHALKLISALALAAAYNVAEAVTPAEQLAGWVAQAGVPAQAARGQQLFTSKHGKEWSCASCHTALPTVEGKHVTTSKAISAMAPAFNAERFTDAAKSEKWFRRNCKDVLGRECSAGEKADVLAWLMSLKH